MSQTTYDYKYPVKICPRDGTPMPIDTPVCSVCGLPVRTRPNRAWVPWVVMITLTCLITFSLASLNHSVFSTFQQDSCIITATWDLVSIGDLTPSTSIYVSSGFPSALTYQVKNAHHQVMDQGAGDLGLKWDSPGYPKANGISDQSRIQTSGTMQCWYSPYACPHVFWSQPDDTPQWWWAWPFSGVILALLYRCVLRLLVYPWQLARRGVQTTGEVFERTKHYSGRYRYYISHVAFHTLTTPALICEAKKEDVLDIHDKVPVCYDPFNPTKNSKVVSSFNYDRALLYTLGGILLILCLSGGLALLALSAIHF